MTKATVSLDKSQPPSPASWSFEAREIASEGRCSQHSGKKLQFEFGCLASSIPASYPDASRAGDSEAFWIARSNFDYFAYAFRVGALESCFCARSERIKRTRKAPCEGERYMMLRFLRFKRSDPPYFGQMYSCSRMATPCSLASQSTNRSPIPVPAPKSEESSVPVGF
jgi:hypothetical protein